LAGRVLGNVREQRGRFSPFPPEHLAHHICQFSHLWTHIAAALAVAIFFKQGLLV
jgi:hypothetical protein